MFLAKGPNQGGSSRQIFLTILVSNLQKFAFYNMSRVVGIIRGFGSAMLSNALAKENKIECDSGNQRI